MKYSQANVELAPSGGIDRSKRFRVIWCTSSAAMVIGAFDDGDEAISCAKTAANRRPDTRVSIFDQANGGVSSVVFPDGMAWHDDSLDSVS